MNIILSIIIFIILLFISKIYNNFQDCDSKSQAECTNSSCFYDLEDYKCRDRLFKRCGENLGHPCIDQLSLLDENIKKSNNNKFNIIPTAMVSCKDYCENKTSSNSSLQSNQSYTYKPYINTNNLKANNINSNNFNNIPTNYTIKESTSPVAFYNHDEAILYKSYDSLLYNSNSMPIGKELEDHQSRVCKCDILETKYRD